MRSSDWGSDVCSSDLPWPVFDYIDGAADDEVTRRRNRAAFDACDLIPRVLAGVDSVDMRTTLFGREMAMPLFLSPTALPRLFHWQRSEGRRVGNGCVSTCRYRWTRYH